MPVYFDDWERERMQDDEFMREVRRQMVVHQLWRLYHLAMAAYYRTVVRVLVWWQARKV